MSSGRTIKRSELYKLVWQEPMMRLAKTFGMSDVGLAKICRKHNIPRPPRGYWAKKQHGQEPREIPLPKSAQDDEIEMRDPSESSRAPELPEAAQAVAAEQQPEMKIEVAESLRGAHELVSQANQELQSARTDQHGIIIRPEKAILEVTVSKTALRRSLLIMDALLKALVERGYEVQRGPGVRILGAVLHFGISEELETKREPVEDVDLEGRYDFAYNRFNQKRTPSGALVLSISEGGAYWLNGCRHRWRDTEKKKLESRLNQFVAALVEMAARIKQHDDEAKAQEELRRQAEVRRQEEARQRAQKRELFKAEKARVEVLLKQATDWQMCKLVRDLVEAARQAHSAAGPIPPESEIGQWLEWANQQADRLDPLRPSPPSILDESIPEDEPPQNRFNHRW